MCFSLKTRFRYALVKPGLGYLFLIFASLCFYTCQQYPFQFQHNQRVAGRTYDYAIHTSEETDILFVVDNSGSMAEEQAELMNNMRAFIEVLTNSTNDYQVGLISTDILRGPDPLCEICCDLDQNQDGKPDWTNCDNGRLYAADFKERILKRPVLTENESEADLQAHITDLVERFNGAVESLGTQGSAFEAPLEAMKQALDPKGDPLVRYLNQDFLRSHANLAIIFLTDEDDCSFPEPWFSQPGRDDADCYYMDGAYVIQDFVDFLAQLKGGIAQIRAAAIVGGVANNQTDDLLNFSAQGCYTDTNNLEASSACGCWTSRHMVDPRDGINGDFYCNYLSEDPFAHNAQRTPIDVYNQGGCTALPGSRLIDFINIIGEQRVAQGFEPGILADSICRANYQETLENIATLVVLSNCFELKEVPANFDAVEVEYNEQILSRVEAHGPDAGWSYNSDRNQICLEGGLTKEVGDTFRISVVVETVGFEQENE